MKQSYPRSSACLSSLYSLKHHIKSKTLFITRRDGFAHTQQVPKLKMSLRVHLAAGSSSSSCTAVPICTTMKILDCGLFPSTCSIWHGGNLILESIASCLSIILASHIVLSKQEMYFYVVHMYIHSHVLKKSNCMHSSKNQISFVNY